MQDRYAGDVGDFGKYGLLRALWGQPGDPSLGIVWYLTGAEPDNNDGRFTRYLEATTKNLATYRNCDPDLYDALARLVNGGTRSVEAVRQAGILPAITRYFAQSVSPAARSRGTGTHLEQRQGWLEEAVMDTLNCEAIFLDPDNGLCPPGTRPGPKHTSLQEVSRFAARDRSVIVYHHIGRQGTAAEQTRAQLARLENVLERAAFALLYHRGSARVFLVSPGRPDQQRLQERASAFLNRGWHNHFSTAGELPQRQQPLLP